MTNHIVIMAGGQGTRLYPLSTAEKPKQFLDLLGVGKSLIRLTYERFLAVDPDAKFWVVTSAAYVHWVREQIPEIPEARILAEPAPRNTAPCIAYACWKIKAENPEGNIIVTPSDAFVSCVDLFAVTLKKALAFTASRTPSIVCVGIRPTTPHTGYGYIQISSRDEGKTPIEADEIHKVAAFQEKPDRATAERYLAEGGYYWNAGIFVWNAATIEAELRAFAPQIVEVFDTLEKSFGTPEEAAETERLFPTCEKISIDYAVMEKSAHVHCIPADWPWDDLGSFASIEKVTGRSIPQEIKDAQDEYQRSLKKK